MCFIWFYFCLLDCKLSVRKSVPWRNSLLPKFGKNRLNYLASTVEEPIRRCHCVLVSIWDAYSYWWKPNTQPSSLFGVATSDGDIMPPFISHGRRLNTEVYIKCLGEVLLLSIEGVTPRRPKVWQQNFAHASQTGESSLRCQKISETTSLLTSVCLTPQIALALSMQRGFTRDTQNSLLYQRWRQV